jgi:hypothetical protein
MPGASPHQPTPRTSAVRAALCKGLPTTSLPTRRNHSVCPRVRNELAQMLVQMSYFKQIGVPDRGVLVGELQDSVRRKCGRTPSTDRASRPVHAPSLSARPTGRQANRSLARPATDARCCRIAPDRALLGNALEPGRELRDGDLPDLSRDGRHARAHARWTLPPLCRPESGSEGRAALRSVLDAVAGRGQESRVRDGPDRGQATGNGPAAGPPESAAGRQVW